MQKDLFGSEERQKLPLDDADIDYFPEWLGDVEAWQLFQQCKQGLTWQQPYIKVMGKLHRIPRKQVWIGDKNAIYTYSQKTFYPETWPTFLQENKRLIETACAAKFNSVLLNYYRSGLDRMGYHADDEPELGAQPVIASLSLGTTRKFVFKRRDGSGRPFPMYLKHGDLLIMRGVTQQFWLHGCPKTQKLTLDSSGIEKRKRETQGLERINLTYRLIGGKDNINPADI